jgi:hypothetical protein
MANLRKKPRRSPLSNIFELRQEIALQKLRQSGTFLGGKRGNKKQSKQTHAC